MIFGQQGNKKSNGRRFFRMNMHAKYILAPKTQTHHADIVHNDIDYFPFYVEESYRKLTSQAYSLINKLEEKQPYLKIVAGEMIERIEFMKNCLYEISLGKNPARDLTFDTKQARYFGYIDEIELIKEHAPKSYKAFSSLERLYVGMSNTCRTIISDSTSNHFSYGFISNPEKVEFIVKQFNKPQYKDIPFAKLILCLAELTLTNYRILRELCIDNSVSTDPLEWPEGSINISEGGARFKMHKRFKMGMPTTLRASIGKELLDFNARIVSINPSDDKEYEYVAINFEFPEPEVQKKIRTIIQSSEIQSAMEAYVNARN